MVYHSQAWQDEFVSNVLNFKRNGYYLDIGSFSAISTSNSYYFEDELKWHGICVEKSLDHNEGYKSRTCHFINDDATKIDYKTILNKEKYPSRIDYLSIDIDENSAEVLKILPLNDYRFSVITIEHDAYRFGNKLKDEERAILSGHSYSLLCSDVLVPLGCGMGPNLPFEDWWVDASVFNMDKLHRLCGDKLYPDNIVDTLKKMADTYVL
jgi:hypothetical protein